MSIVSTNIMGGLGNMLFQISTSYSLSLRDNKTLICDTRNMTIPHKPYSEYVENIFRKVKFSNQFENLQNFYEKNFDYTEIPKFEGNLKILGYFQSEKYFINHRHEVLKLFEIDEKTDSYIKKKYGLELNEDTCSIHVRRGDYLNLQKHHPVQSIDYYKNSINIIGEDKTYFIFSDDLKWCQENFNFLKKSVFVSDNLDFEDLYLMSMCKNNIIANSTFSWWGAWMNQNNNKKVIAPKDWFGVANSHLNTKDLYCENWIKI
jgi:hypothetical protein